MTRSRRGPSSLDMPRTRGVVSGLLLIMLGAWGALVPFVGPYFHWAYTPDQPWVWTAARGWLEVFPGVTTVVGGLLLVGTGNRATAMFGGWLAAFAGAWFVVGSAFASTLRIGDIGHAVATTEAKRALLEVTYFTGLGVLIVFLGGVVLARLSVRTARDVVPTPAPAPDVPAADVASDSEYDSPDHSMVPNAEVSPDAATQARAQQSPAQKPGKSSFFRRKHVNANS